MCGDIVVEDGAYVYDASANVLKVAVAGDLRKQTGSQDFVGVAPLDLVYVADLAKLSDATPNDRILYWAAEKRVILAQTVGYPAAPTGK